MEITLGCDPEVFVRDTSTGKFICGEGLIQGDKRNPFKVAKGAIQVDGTALEFNIDPAKTQAEFVGNVARVFGDLQVRVKKINPKYELVASPVADFDPAYFKKISVEAKRLGCEPDYNAYTGKANPAPQGDRPFRTGSGHIHVGWTEGQDPMEKYHFLVCREVASILDMYLLPQSLLWDSDDRRRDLYGNPGAFRPKSYGMEYRVLSNAWLRDPALIKWVYDQINKALDDFSKQYTRPGTNAYQFDQQKKLIKHGRKLYDGRVYADYYFKGNKFPERFWDWDKKTAVTYKGY